MASDQFRRDNHYLSRGYLKRWASADHQLWMYRTLVSHPGVPLWKRVSPRGIAYHAHLYTQIVAGKETDQFERWLDQEFESPAEEALGKATSDARMTPDDWYHLLRFAVAQDLRTPARFEEDMRRWQATLPELLDKSVRSSVRKLDKLVKSGRALPKEGSRTPSGFPVRVVKSIDPDQEMGQISAQVVAGRELWLWNIRRLLEGAAKVAHQHNWTILRPPRYSTWFTSDNPVIRLNFHSPDTYDFGGGWDNRGSEIIFPLGPQHLLYTQIGKRPPIRGQRMSGEQARIIRRLVAEHAHRMVFAVEPCAEILELRPRVADEELFRSERDLWARWHEDQIAAEHSLRVSTEES